MERVDIVVKATIAILTGIISLITGLFGLLFTVLLGLIFLDIVTGLMAAKYSGEGFKSSKGIKGLFRKCYIIILIGAIFMIEISVLKTKGVVTDGISAAYAVMELISIIENGGRMGAPIPQRLKKLITSLKNTVGEIEEETTKEDNK